MGANTRLDGLSDLVKHKANLRVTCRTCDKVSVVDAQRFNRYCLLRCWNTQIEALGQRLVCSRCGARAPHLKATRERPGPDPFPKDERAWKLLFRRLRD
ncbi:hypothetical protein ACFQPG_10790 [Sphingomonas sp. GCM10030256]|uniref:hypothetical protein n=1 Tax=Sphingomonas sp. GCM10030256 TaxID=3273427 RepID=UPI00361D63BB